MEKAVQKPTTSWLKKIWAQVGFVGLIAILLWGNLIYMNLRPADPILPGWEEYSTPRFEELMKRGEPLLVEVYASWCPTCLLQHEALETLHKEGRGPQIRAIRVDFDRDGDFREAFGFNHTGTMVLFNDGREAARQSGLITPDKIQAFLAQNGF
ncbi:MAG: thioredoxin family protein [Kordiimonadaceae bacterium]|nr:thioredoxin family protein [Kordiimonadaceae bacterium]MBO6569921.1 thioredoxin family protein [Kordiimonadaceae bacterium]MBO6965982.1 thioredoxin family protein [Kordiimonadaceae bacterium]